MATPAPHTAVTVPSLGAVDQLGAEAIADVLMKGRMGCLPVAFSAAILLGGMIGAASSGFGLMANNVNAYTAALLISAVVFALAPPVVLRLLTTRRLKALGLDAAQVVHAQRVSAEFFGNSYGFNSPGTREALVGRLLSPAVSPAPR